MRPPMAHFVCRMVLAVSVFIALDTAKVAQCFIGVKMGIVTNKKDVEKQRLNQNVGDWCWGLNGD